VNQQLHRLALELLVVSFLNLLFLHGFSLFTPRSVYPVPLGLSASTGRKLFFLSDKERTPFQTPVLPAHASRIYCATSYPVGRCKLAARSQAFPSALRVPRMIVSWRLSSSGSRTSSCRVRRSSLRRRPPARVHSTKLSQLGFYHSFCLLSLRRVQLPQYAQSLDITFLSVVPSRFTMLFQYC